jgi:tetratricopeptide (TPR) repeat protein
LRAIQENAREIARQFGELRAFELFEFAQGATPRPAPRPAPPAPPAPFVRYSGNDDPDDDNQELYDDGREHIDDGNYDRAVAAFNQLIARRAKQADAATYWKAYSENKQARRQEALATLAELPKQFPKSAWLDDARKLDVEIRQSSGQPVTAGALDDEELKIFVIQNMMQSDPEAALPQIEKMLAGSGSVRLKQRALYLASRSRSPRGRQVVVAAAKSSSNPDLQMAAIQSLGRMAGAESGQALEEMYRATSDRDVKRRILQALATANASDRLGPIARSEKDPELKRQAIRQLGMSRQADVGETLTAIYNGDASIEIRKAVIDALAQNSRNETSIVALVALARVEKNQELQTAMVRRLSQMKSAAARDYMLEILAK